jgi:hypothetical protein
MHGSILIRVPEIRSKANNPEEYKQALLEAYPFYTAAKLIDIYSPIFLAIKNIN